MENLARESLLRMNLHREFTYTAREADIRIRIILISLLSMVISIRVDSLGTAASTSLMVVYMKVFSRMVREVVPEE